MREGDVIRSGIVDIGMVNEATIEGINDSSICINLGLLTQFKQSNTPKVDLILAVPRPAR